MHHTTKFTFSSDKLQNSLFLNSKNPDSKIVRIEDEEEKCITNEQSLENDSYIWKEGNTIILCILAFCIEASKAYSTYLIFTYKFENS